MTEEEVYAGRFRDLAERSYQNCIFTFSDFLDAAGQDLLHRMERELQYAGITLYGGRENADRVMVRFGKESDLGYEQAFPVCCLRIEPAAAKYAESLTHRDYLGALMGLGIERELLGDIVTAPSAAWLFCVDHIADYILGHLFKVRRTGVRVVREEQVPQDIQPHFEEMLITAASLRLDGIISSVFRLSRTQGQDLFRAGKVYVNGRICENRSCLCREGDIVSVRGFGKFIFDAAAGSTRKGREQIRIRRFTS